jgi:DNA-binding transcriptional ArsR family regulator
METQPDLSTIAALIGDQTRAAILSALLSGQALPASELAYRAHITPQTTSAHLNKLMEGGLIAVNQIGRHRYYRLKNAQVARALEALAVISPPPRVKSKQESDEMQALCLARTCYDHLAGKLGVAVTQALVDQGYLALHSEHFEVTDQGANWLAIWNIDPAQLRKGRRAFARTCLDWSERRDHLAGALGAAIANQFFEKGWVTRIPGGRSLHITAAGRSGIAQAFGIDITA